jgi:ribosome-associated toxin RatA of RatAB toxin-antitoxin module
MATIHRSALISFSDQQIYALINDIAAYPDFLEGCVGAEVLQQDDKIIEARLDLAKAGLRYSFTTRNQLTPYHSISMALVEGPFSTFSGQWTIKALNESACKVDLEIRFSLKNSLMSMAAEKLFNPLGNNLVDAIVKRAYQLYK